MRDWRRRRAIKLRNKDSSTTTTAPDASWSDLHVPTTSQQCVQFPELESEVLILKKQIKRMKNYERVKRYRARKRAQQQEASNASQAYETSQSESSDSMRKISEGRSLLKVKHISDKSRTDVSIMEVSAGQSLLKHQKDDSISKVSMDQSLMKTESILPVPQRNLTNVSEDRKDDSTPKTSAIHIKDNEWVASRLHQPRRRETLVGSQEEFEKKKEMKKLRNAANVRAFRERQRQLILEAESKLDTKLLEPEILLTSDPHILLQPDNIGPETPIPSYTEIPVYLDIEWTQLPRPEAPIPSYTELPTYSDSELTKLPFKPEVSLMEYRETSIPSQEEVLKRNEEIRRSKNAEYVRAYRERKRNTFLEAEKNLEVKTKLKSEPEERRPQSQVQKPINQQTDVWNPPLYKKALPSIEEIERKRLIQRKRNAERVRAHRERKRAALRESQAESQAPTPLKKWEDLREVQATLEKLKSQKPPPLKTSERVRAYRERKRTAFIEAQGILCKPECKPPRPLTSAERVRAYRERKRAAMREALATFQNPEFQEPGPSISSDQKRNALKAELQSAVSLIQIQSEVPKTKCQKGPRTPWSELKTLIQKARSETLRSLEEAGINMEDDKFIHPHFQSNEAVPDNTPSSSTTSQSSLEVTQHIPSQDAGLTEKVVIQRLKNAQYVRAFRERQRVLKALHTLPKTSQSDQSEDKSEESKSLKVVISSEKDSPNKLKFRFIKDS